MDRANPNHLSIAGGHGADRLVQGSVDGDVGRGDEQDSSSRRRKVANRRRYDVRLARPRWPPDQLKARRATRSDSVLLGCLQGGPAMDLLEVARTLKRSQGSAGQACQQAIMAHCCEAVGQAREDEALTHRRYVQV